MSELGLIKLFMNMFFEFLRRDFIEQEVRVEIIGDAEPVITVEGYLELSKGAEYMLPRRIAYKLVEKGVARIKEDKISLEELSKIIYNEESSKHKLQLYKIHQYLYSLARIEISKLEKMLEKGGRVELYEEYKNLIDLYSTLLMLREKKIINLLNLPVVPQDLVDKMSEEEKILFSTLRTSLKEWENNMGIGKEHI